MKLIKGFFMLVGGGITLLIILGVIGAMLQNPEATGTATKRAEAPARQAQVSTPPKAEEPVDRLTGAQKNAARSAKNYLSFSGFSREGLI